MVIIKEKNKGIFKLSQLVTKDPAIMAAFFAHFTPLKFDLDLSRGVYFMLCESDLFSDIKEGDPIPFYDAEITQGKDGIMNVSNIERY
jgi:hypothetical protein